MSATFGAVLLFVGLCLLAPLSSACSPAAAAARCCRSTNSIISFISNLHANLTQWRPAQWRASRHITKFVLRAPLPLPSPRLILFDIVMPETGTEGSDAGGASRGRRGAALLWGPGNEAVQIFVQTIISGAVGARGVGPPQPRTTAFCIDQSDATMQQPPRLTGCLCFPSGRGKSEPSPVQGQGRPARRGVALRSAAGGLPGARQALAAAALAWLRCRGSVEAARCALQAGPGCAAVAGVIHAGTLTGVWLTRLPVAGARARHQPSQPANRSARGLERGAARAPGSRRRRRAPVTPGPCVVPLYCRRFRQGWHRLREAADLACGVPPEVGGV